MSNRVVVHVPKVFNRVLKVFTSAKGFNCDHLQPTLSHSIHINYLLTDILLSLLNLLIQIFKDIYLFLIFYTLFLRTYLLFTTTMSLPKLSASLRLQHPSLAGLHA